MSANERRDLTVFVVDDSDLLRERLIEMLREVARVKVIGEAAERDQAIAGIERLRPDVVILDIRLEGGSGIEVLTEVKKATPSPTVIMLTNYPYIQFQEKCLKAGADYFFYKASGFTKIKDVVAGLASTSATGSPSTSPSRSGSAPTARRTNCSPTASSRCCA